MSALPYGLESDSEGIQLNEVFFALGSISCKKVSKPAAYCDLSSCLYISGSYRGSMRVG